MKSILTISLCLLLSVQQVFADTGKHLILEETGELNGKVYLPEGDLAIGAYLSIAGTKLQAVSGVDGSYTIQDVPYGTHVLKVTYLGTEDMSIDVTIASEATKLDVNLSENTTALDAVVVRGKTQAREQQERAFQIESVSLKAVSNRVKDVSEIIDQLPGVNVRGSGSFGDQVDISLNGLNGTAVRTYIDGLPLEFVYPQFTINNLPISNIGRVDVYKGVVPIDVGTDALGGGVNVITRQRNVNELTATYGYGSFGTHQANLLGNYSIAENVSVGANLSYNSSQNNYKMNAFVWEEQEEQEIERFHDAYRMFFGSAYIDIRSKKWADRFRFTASLNDYYKEVQHGARINNTAFGNVFYDGGGSAFSLMYNKQLGDRFNIETVSSYSRSNVIFKDTTANVYSWSGDVVARLDRGEFAGASDTDQNYDNYINRFNLRWYLSSSDGLLLSNLVAYQDIIGRNKEEDLENDALARPQHLLKDIVGLQYKKSLLSNKLTLSAAAKLYYYNLEGVTPQSLVDVKTKESQFGYYGTAKYAFNDRFFIRGSYENALRIPTFYQFFGNGANIVSNIELKSETSDNVNLGFFYASSRKKKLSYDITANGFFRGQKNLISLTSGQFLRHENADDVRTTGVEGSATLRWQEKLKLIFNITSLKQVFASINPNNPSAQYLVGTSFPNVPKFFYNTRLSYQIGKLIDERHQLGIYAQYKYIDEFNYIIVGQIHDPQNYVPVQQRVDLGLNFSLYRGRILLAMNANNIFDADNFDNYSIPRPGRNFNMKLTYKIINSN